DGLALGRLADQAIALVGERDHAGGDAMAFLIGNDLHLAAFHDRDDGVGGPQVDADDFFFSHVSVRSFRTAECFVPVGSSAGPVDRRMRIFLSMSIGEARTPHLATIEQLTCRLWDSAWCLQPNLVRV